MNNMVGADVEALQRLASQFDQSAERLRSRAGEVGDGIRVSAWVGPIAMRFKIAWDSTHSVSLKRAADALHEGARILRQNAAEQQAASSSLQAGAGTYAATHPGSGSLDPDAIAPRDYLALAKSAGGHDLPPGWHRLTADELRELGIDPGELNTKNGMNASVVVDGNGRYVLIFEGSSSNGGDIDWTRENARSAAQSGVVGGVASQAGADVAEIVDPGSSTEEAMTLALKLKNAVGADHLSLTGHSLGGRQAAASSMVTGCEAVTFNAAGVTNNDRLFARGLAGDPASFGEYALGRAGVPIGADDSHVTNYHLDGDPLTFAQTMTAASDAAGHQVAVQGSGHGLGGFEGKI